MSTVEEATMSVDPEMAKIWAEDEDLDFIAMRANEEQEEPESEQPEDTDVSTEDSEEDETIVDEVEEESTEDKPEVTEETVEDKPSSYKVKANNMEMELTVEELQKLAPKALDYTKKMQEIAPWRKSISALKENGLGEQDINLMIDVLKGDKNAINEVLKRTKVDPLELDTDGKQEYVPTSYGKDELSLRIDEIVQEIGHDEEYRITANIVDDVWDSKSREEFRKNPDLIVELHKDVKSGVYDKIAPMAMKMKVLDGAKHSDMDYYIEAGRQYYQGQEKVAEVQKVSAKQESIKDMADKRKAATPTKSTSGKRSVIDYLDDNDEEFDEWYKKLQANR